MRHNASRTITFGTLFRNKINRFSNYETLYCSSKRHRLTFKYLYGRFKGSAIWPRGTVFNKRDLIVTPCKNLPETTKSHFAHDTYGNIEFLFKSHFTTRICCLEHIYQEDWYN